MAPVCIMCDGATRDEARASLRDKIESFGWAAQGVMPADGFPGWLYTIGLIERFGHPELVVTTCDPAAASSLLRDLLGQIEAGASLVGLEQVILPSGDYELGQVHAAQLRAGLLASWTDLYRSEGRFDLELDAILVDTPELTCGSCRVVDLRAPGPILNMRPTGRSPRPSGPNRKKRQNRKSPTRPGQYEQRRRPK